MNKYLDETGLAYFWEKIKAEEEKKLDVVINDNTFYFTDANRNIIAKIDSDGVHSTDFKIGSENISILSAVNALIESLPAAQVLADWNLTNTSAADYIKNKPSIPTIPDLEKGTTTGNGNAVTDISVSGHTITLTKGTTFLTSHQDISGKEDKTGIIAVVDTVDATLPVSSLTCETDKYYRLDVPVETLAVTLPEMSNVTVVKTVVLYLTGGTTPAVTISSTAPSGGTAPAVHFSDGYAIESGNTYEVNCAWNGLAWIVASFKINTSNS